MKNTKKILLLENYRQTLAVARSLMRAGHEVHAVVDERSPGLYDRAIAVSNALTGVCPLPAFDSPRFLPQLSEWCRRERIDALFPVGEVALPHLQPGLAELPPVLGVRPEIRELFLDKARGGEVARAAGLALPASSNAGGPHSVLRAIEEVGLPCVVKPLDSLRPLSRKAWVLHEPPETELLEELEGSGVPLLVQAFVQGRRVNCMFLARQGELCAYFEDEVLRTDRADGTGIGMVERSVAPTPALQEQVRSLLRQLDYDGPGCLQFIDDGRTAWFLECNPRLDATVALAIHCGVDFPRLSVEARLNPDPAAGRGPDAYPVGRVVNGLLGELEGSLHALLNREPLGRILGWQVRAVLDAARADCSLLADRADPRPARLLGRNLLQSALRRASGRRPRLSSESA